MRHTGKFKLEFSFSPRFFAIVIHKFLIMMIKECGGQKVLLRRFENGHFTISTGPCCCCCLCLPRVPITRWVTPLRTPSLKTAAGIQPAWQDQDYGKTSQKSVSGHLKLSLLNSIISLGLYTTTNLFHFYNAGVCGRRNFYSRKPNNWHFSFFSFQKGTNVLRLGIFHKQNCQMEALLIENFSHFDKMEMFHSDFDFKTTWD